MQENKTLRVHYRSKLYTSSIGVNPLVAAAHPLFSILDRINLSEKPPELTSLQDNIAHELQAFTTNISVSEHSEEVALLARYLLCATIDEVIEKAYLRHNLPYVSQTSHDMSNQAPFFQILEKTLLKPDFYLDLIELGYFCMMTGFEGQYRNEPHGKQALENWLDNLYQVIIAHKPPTVEKLFVSAVPTRRFLKVKPFPWRRSLLIFIGLMTLGYFVAGYYLHQKATLLVKSYATQY